MNNIIRTEVPLTTINPGDIVEVNGQLLTVGRNDVKFNSFMGYSFRGDASKKTITKIQFAVPTAFGVVLR